MQFSEFIKANVKLYALRNQRPLRTSAVANFIRNELATALRQARLHKACCVRVSEPLRAQTSYLAGFSLKGCSATCSWPYQWQLQDETGRTNLL